MNDMIVKNVDVLGSQIMAAKDSEGKIYAGVNYFCNALGMTAEQIENENAQQSLDLGKGGDKA